MNFNIVNAMNELNEIFAQYSFIKDLRDDLQRIHGDSGVIDNLNHQMMQLQNSAIEVQRRVIEAFDELNGETLECALEQEDDYVSPPKSFNLN